MVTNKIEPLGGLVLQFLGSESLGQRSLKSSNAYYWWIVRFCFPTLCMRLDPWVLKDDTARVLGKIPILLKSGQKCYCILDLQNQLSPISTLQFGWNFALGIFSGWWFQKWCPFKKKSHFDPFLPFNALMAKFCL